MVIMQESVTFFQHGSLKRPIQKQAQSKVKKHVVHYFVYNSHYFETKLGWVH